MPIPTPCSIGELLEAARLTLVASGVFTDAQAFLGLDADDVMLNPVSSPVCCLTFDAFDQRDESIHAEIDQSDTPTMEGTITCSMWIRIAIDLEGQDKVFLNINDSNVRGASEMIRQVVGSLNNAPLYNADNNLITWRTLNLLGFRNRGKWRQDKTWRRIDVRFDACFNLKVTGTTPVVETADYFQTPYYSEPYFPKPMFV